MSTQSYKQLIQDGIRNLPEELLAEIANFVYFVRLRASQPDLSPQDMHDMALSLELSKLSSKSQAHLAEEFAEYEVNFPKE